MTVPHKLRRSVRGAAALAVGLTVTTVGLATQGNARAQTADSVRLGLEVAVEDRLYPGISRPVELIVTNPSSQPIRLTTLSVTVSDRTTLHGHPNPGCAGLSNFAVSENLDPTRTVLTVPAYATRSLSDLAIPQNEWPAVEMRNLDTDQDACRGAEITLLVSAGSDRIPPS